MLTRVGHFPLSMSGGIAAASPLGELKCASCHGFDGIGQDDGIPNLAGQHRTHLERHLLTFQRPLRSSTAVWARPRYDDLCCQPRGLERYRLILINASKWLAQVKSIV